MREPYRYCGLEAASYDRLDELSGFEDLPFYRLCLQARPGPVLDIGCGTGRVLIPLLEAGEDVAGLEYSSQMLDLCRSKLEGLGLAAPLHQGDMRDFHLEGQRFATIIIPGYTAQLLDSKADLLKCLRNCRAHLEAEGQVIVPLYMPHDYLAEDAACGPLELRKEVTDAVAGERWRAWQAWSLDRHQQQLTLRNVIERSGLDGELREREDKRMTLRCYTPHELIELMQKAGFAEIELYGDYTQNPPEADSETVVFVARADVAPA